MNRDFLEKLGLEKEIIEKVMAEHGKAIQAAKPDDYEELKTSKETLEKQVKDLNGTLTATTEKYAGYDENIAELNGKVKDYEVKNLKYKIANEAGLPLELANRLSGESEEDIKKDAESLKSLIPGQPHLPLKSTEKDVDDEHSPYKKIIEGLKLN